MKDSWILRFLYKTAPGRCLLKLMVQPSVSRGAGGILSLGISKYMIPYYIKKHHIDMSDICIPPGGFSSFNHFFTRKRKQEDVERIEGHVYSPCDGFLTAVRIHSESVFSIKHTQYALEDLLQDRSLAETFNGGVALIFRLTPADYHRYGYAADGRILSSMKIEGKLHCVRPIALRTVPVYVQNSREYQVIATKDFGTVIQMEVGALLVGKIENDRRMLEQRYVQAGEEKGHFAFGGSTIILCFPKDSICLNRSLREKHKGHEEIRVRMGEDIAHKKGAAH